MKWWSKVVWRLHDHAITNAYVIYKKNNDNATPLTNLQFRLKLAEVLSEPLLRLRVLGQIWTSTRPTAEMKLTGKHFLYHSPNRRQCAVCACKEFCYVVAMVTMIKCDII